MSHNYIRHPSPKLLQDLRECIHALLECDAFELQVHIAENGQTDYYLPYMMNDALEYYFILKNCRMTGEYNSKNLDSSNEKKFGDFADFTGNPAVELIENTDCFALVIRQTPGEIATIWFQDIEKEMKCYRYHEIGHFWVKGEEHYRQLVYMIGTIYDKLEYLGESICNDKEQALLPLMEFAPFRYWSPIHESLDARYPDTLDGIETFHDLCEEAGDISLVKWPNDIGKFSKKLSASMKNLNLPLFIDLHLICMRSLSFQNLFRSLPLNLPNQVTKLYMN